MSTFNSLPDPKDAAEWQRALAQSEERWRTLIDNVADFVLLVDREGKIESINRTRATRPNVVGTFGIDYVYPEYHAAIQQAIADCFAGGGPFDLLAQETEQDSWFSIRLAPIFEGDSVVKVIAICTDTTLRRQAEIALADANELLEERVEERTGELRVINQLLREQRERLRSMLDMQNRDRQLIAFEIHDGMVQDMTASTMFLEGCRDALADSPALEYYDKGMLLLRDSIAEARALIGGLRPPILEGEGLEAAIASLVEEFAVRHDFVVNLRWNADVKRLAPALETAIYRTIQEALNNVVHHAKVESADVLVERRDDRMHLQIRDQGVGFDVDKANKSRHGLRGIRERAQVLGGESKIISEVGQGTTVEVIMPVIDALSPG